VNLAAYEQAMTKSKLANRAVRCRRRANKFWRLPRVVQRLLGGHYMGLALELIADQTMEEYLNEQGL
jgi:hypothetical protein